MYGVLRKLLPSKGWSQSKARLTVNGLVGRCGISKQKDGTSVHLKAPQIGTASGLRCETLGMGSLGLDGVAMVDKVKGE